MDTGNGRDEPIALGDKLASVNLMVSTYHAVPSLPMNISGCALRSVIFPPRIPPRGRRSGAAQTECLPWDKKQGLASPKTMTKPLLLPS